MGSHCYSTYKKSAKFAANLLRNWSVRKKETFLFIKQTKVSRVYFTGKALTVKQLKKEGVGASDISIESVTVVCKGNITDDVITDIYDLSVPVVSA